MISPLVQLVSLALLGAGPAYEAPNLLDTETATRLQQLEAETQALRAELQTFRSQQVAMAVPTLAAPETSPLAAPQPAMVQPLPPVQDDMQYFTLDELKAEMKKLVWKKGDFTITPYGWLWGTMTYETERTFTGDYVLYVFPANVEGEPAFHMDAKSTRLGFDLTGPRIPLFCCAPSGGKVEIDFQGAFVTENKASILLRHAYMEVKDEDFRLLFGQTWDVISPLYPGMLMYSVGWGGGNIGYRRAQLRGERYLAFSDHFLITAQGSLNTDIITDTATSLAGDHSGWPVLEGRVGTTFGQRGPGCLPIEFGVSGHVGEQIFDFRAPIWPDPVDDLARKTWSVNADIRIPITNRFGVQAEFFTGANLGAFLGGILQGIDVGTPTDVGSREPIRSTGGWVDVWYDWTPRLHSHVGYSIDDPLDSDVTVGRIYNQFYFANVSFDVTKKFLVGVEMTSWKTLWVANEPGNSVNTAFVAKYGF